MPGKRLGALLDLVGRAGHDDAAAVDAGTGTEVDDVIGREDGLLVVFDDDHRVTDVPQMRQRAEQALVVALVQADRRFVEDVHDADQSRTDLAGQPYALRLAAGQRIRAAVERQVVETDVGEESEAGADFLDDLLRDLRPPALELQRIEELACVADGQAGYLRQGLVEHEHVTSRAVQAGAAAVGAGLARQKFREFLAHRARLGLVVAPFQVRDHAFETMQLLDLHAAGVLVVELDLLLATAVQDDVAQLLRQLVERRLDVETVVFRQALDHLVVIGRLSIPAADRAAGERQVLVLDDALGIEELPDAEAVAARAGARRVVEGEQARLEFGQRIAADIAGKTVGEDEFLGLCVIHECDAGDAVGEPERGLE